MVVIFMKNIFSFVLLEFIVYLLRIKGRNNNNNVFHENVDTVSCNLFLSVIYIKEF